MLIQCYCTINKAQGPEGLTPGLPTIHAGNPHSYNKQQLHLELWAVWRGRVSHAQLLISFFSCTQGRTVNSKVATVQSSLAATVPSTAFPRQGRHSEAQWQVVMWMKEGAWHLLGALSLL